MFSVWSSIVSVSSRRSSFSRHAVNHFVNSSLLVMPRFSTRFGNFARPRSLWTKSLTPPSLYSSTSYSMASPETSVKKPMVAPASTWKNIPTRGSSVVPPGPAVRVDGISLPS